jgi:uncharacterized protein
VRLVLDTNVLIAAFATRGTCHDLLEHCVQQHQVVASDFIYRELEGKLLTKVKLPAAKAAAAVALLRSRLELVHPDPLAVPACRDPDDDWILATAVAGSCALLITGDRDLLEMKTFRGIQILAPGHFWAYESAGRNL